MNVSAKNHKTDQLYIVIDYDKFTYQNHQRQDAFQNYAWNAEAAFDRAFSSEKRIV